MAPFVVEVDSDLPTVLDPREAVEAGWVPLDVWRDPTRKIECHVSSDFYEATGCSPSALPWP